MVNNDIIHCQFHNWYPLFPKNVPKAIQIPLSIEFVEFLIKDGISIPDIYLENNYKNAEIIDLDDILEEDNDNDDKDLDHETFFPNIIQKIEHAIYNLGGKIFCKLNWSSPNDATWITTTKSLQCISVGEILLLLKSSSKVAHDIINPYYDDQLIEHDKKNNDVKQQNKDNDLQYYLVLQKWCNYHNNSKFRCFVINNELVGISQYEFSYFEHLKSQKQHIKDLIINFFNINIKKSKFILNTYIFDLYKDKNDKIWIINIKPLKKKFSDFKLFSNYEELLKSYEEQEEKKNIIFKITEKNMRINHQQTAHNIIQRLPDENLDISDNKGIEYMIQLMKLQNKQDLK